jgi:hypothetical protein
LFHGDYSWSWTPVAKKFADKLVEEYKIDVIMGEHGPDAGILLANSFSKKYNIPWIADFRDPALRFLTGFFATLYKRVVQRIVSSASCTLTVSDYWSRLDEALFNKKSHVILNGYDQDLFEHTPTHEFSKFTVSYFGSFDQSYQDIIPSLQTFLHFLKENNYSSDIQLFYRGLAYKEFLQHAVDLDIPLTHLNVQGFCSREETAAYMKGSQVLLIYSVASHKKNNVYEAQGVYPGKVFEYLGANQPILLIPSDHGIMEKLISSCKSGMATTSVNQANAFLQTKYNDWSLHIPAQCATSPDKAYSRRYQASQLDRILIDILGLQAE